jgi:biopolymer transport protein ExbB
MDISILWSLDPLTLGVFSALGVLSILAIAVTFFKSFQFARLGVGQMDIAEEILDDWLNGRVDAAVRAAALRESVLARILQAVFSGLQTKPDDQSFAEELGRQTALVELGHLTRRMRVLEVVVQAAPMLGLLGTVIGMIDAFGTLSTTAGSVDPTLLASGIWTALTTTAAGLAIAILTFFIASWLESRIEFERQSIETLISSAVYGRVDTSPAPG